MCYACDMSPSATKIISLRLDADVMARWDALSQRNGLDSGKLMRDAIVERLEELEDFYAVRTRLASPFTPVSSEQVWKETGDPTGIIVGQREFDAVQEWMESEPTADERDGMKRLAGSGGSRD